MYAIHQPEPQSPHSQLSLVVNHVKPPLRARWFRDEEGNLICKWS